MKSESEGAQSFPTLSHAMDCSLPDSPVHGFSRQEYWSGVPLPSPETNLEIYIYTETHKRMTFYETEILAVFRAHNSGIFTEIAS